MKANLTSEQRAARESRRARFKELWKEVAAKPEAERMALCARLGIVTCEGRPLSMNNMCLVALQHPSATIVGGFRQWLKQGRCVKKGEHGSMIWVPIGRKSSIEPTEADEPADGKDEKGPRARFIPGNVFDIGQTEALPEAPASNIIDLANVVFDKPEPTTILPPSLVATPRWRRQI